MPSLEKAVRYMRKGHTVRDKGVAVPAPISDGLLYGDQGTARTHPMSLHFFSLIAVGVLCFLFVFVSLSLPLQQEKPVSTGSSVLDLGSFTHRVMQIRELAVVS